MKYIHYVDETSFSLASLLGEHVNKCWTKHELELQFLDDVKNFLEAKSQIELRYAQALGKLCGQYTRKAEYDVNGGGEHSPFGIYIPEKWKSVLEQYSYMAEKRRVASESLLVQCEYFRQMREQKRLLNQTAVLNMKKLHEMLHQSAREHEDAFRSHLFERLVLEQLTDNNNTSGGGGGGRRNELDAKLKKCRTNMSKLNKSVEQMKKSGPGFKQRQRAKLDLAKLNYVTANTCLNMQLHYYFSVEVPRLLHLQHGRVEPFVSHCLDALVFRDTDAHKPLVQLSDHPTPHQEGHIIQQQQQQPFHSENVTVSALASCMLPHGDTYFFEQHACFNSLVQYKLATDDHDHDDNDTDHQDEDNNVFDESSMSMSVAPRRYAAGKHHFLELHRHGEHLSSVHAKCARKLDELERLMQHMLVQVNDKQREAIERASVAGSPQHDQKQRFMVDYGQQTESRRDADFCVDHELERQLAQLALKQLRMMPLKAKIRALQSFATPESEGKRVELRTVARQQSIELVDAILTKNLAKWDKLMKSIEESYDLDMTFIAPSCTVANVQHVRQQVNVEVHCKQEEEDDDSPCACESTGRQLLSQDVEDVKHKVFQDARTAHSHNTNDNNINININDQNNKEREQQSVQKNASPPSQQVPA